MDINTQDQALPLAERYGIAGLKSDDDCAAVLIDRTHQDYRYTPQVKDWSKWTDANWERQNATAGITLEVSALAKQMKIEAADLPHNEGITMFKQGNNLGNLNTARRVVEWASLNPLMRMPATGWDVDPLLFNTSSGTVDLSTGELRPHRREDYITKLADAPYYPNATAPAWDRFLAQVLDTDVCRYLQKAVGIALTGTTPEHNLYVNYGFGANGKSTFFEAIMHVMGDYAGLIDLDLLMEKQNTGSATPEIVNLIGKRLVVGTETQQGEHLNEPMIKRLTGDAELQGRPLYGDPITFKRQFDVFMHTNHKPEISGIDNGIWRRVKLIPWNVTIADEDMDKDLPQKLRAGASGILRWAVEGYKLYQEEGLTPPKAISEATDEYRAAMNKVGRFLDDCCTSGDKLYIPKAKLYQEFKYWCDDNGHKAESTAKFGQKLREMGQAEEGQKKLNGTNTKVWKGIGLLSEQREW